jgi:hypothetical protein
MRILGDSCFEKATPMTFRMPLDLSFNHGNPIKMAAYKIFCRLLIQVSFLLLAMQWMVTLMAIS